MGKLARQLERESLEQELKARKSDFDGVDKKYRRETNPAEKNALKAQRAELLAQIQVIEQQLDNLGVAKDQELIDTLQPIFQQYLDVVRLAYRCALPPRRVIAETSDDVSLSQWFVNLKLLSNGESYSPLVKFVAYLLLDPRLNSDLNLKARLRSWIQEDIADVDALITVIKQEKQEREVQNNPCLLVSVSKRDAKYVAEAWIIGNPQEYDGSSVSGCHRVQIDGKIEWTTDRTLEKMPDLLRRLRNRCIEQHCEIPIHQINVFLPSELIGHTVDTWQSDEDEDEELSMTFGEDYELVVRYSERLRDETEEIKRWRQKGRQMKQRLDQPATDAFLLGNDSNPKRLLIQMKEAATIAVKLPSSARPKDVGKLFLKAGIPLALWIREPLQNLDCAAALDTLLNECADSEVLPTLQEVPTRVKSTRQSFSVDDPATHIGRHLSLLWDDPDLVPPKQLLSQQNL